MTPFASRSAGVAQLCDFASVLDVRSPLEFASDRIPGAINVPVLDDAERVLVGTLHRQQSAFAARRVGAAIVARNIARILDTLAADQPREWAPLVYCWRGGQRSRSLALVLNEIGFRAKQLVGGYKAFRAHVVDTLDVAPARFRYVVLCGLTGSGKSRLLAALAASDAQVLDLEALAGHRGSLLGDDPSLPQPSQKHFETRLFDAFARFDPARTVFVESESQRIGTLQVPPPLLAVMRASSCIDVVTPTPARVDMLIEDYAHWCADPAALHERLLPLTPLVGRKAIDRWQALAQQGDFATLVSELLVQHYDPAYRRSIGRNYPGVVAAPTLELPALDRASLAEVARSLATRPLPAASSLVTA